MDVQKATSSYRILCVLCAADREVSPREVEVIIRFVQDNYGFTNDPRLLIEDLRVLLALTPERMVQQIKDDALTFKSLSTAQERVNLLAWARQNISSDGKISGEERALFECLTSIFNVGADIDAMRQAQQQYDVGSKVLEWNHQRIMNNLSMWRTSW